MYFVSSLRFNLLLDKESTGPETSCQIQGDMFDVEIFLDGRDTHFSGPAVLDVKVKWSEHKQSCPELVDIIRFFYNVLPCCKALLPPETQFSTGSN